MTGRVYITEWDGTLVTEVVVYAKAEWRVRFNDAGLWSLTLPRDTILQVVERGRKVLLLYGDAVLTGVILGVDLRPGQVQGLVYGMDDFLYLAARLAYPEVHGNFSSQAYDVRSGPVETVVKGYVRDNASQAAALPERAFPFTVATDQGRGDTVTGRARFHDLLELCRNLVAAAGNTLRMRLRDGMFEMEPVADRRGAPTLADWRGGEWGVAWRAPAVTTVLAGGTGEGTSRLIAQATNTNEESTFWRVEDFYDLRSTGDMTELTQRANERLAQGVSRYGFVMRAVARGYGDEYEEGDLITAQAAGVAVDARVEEVVIRYEENRGWYEEVGVGVMAAPEVWTALRRRWLAQAVQNLEVV